MHDTMHHLHSSSGEKDRVFFFFECDTCNVRKAIFENGEEWVHKPDLCKKCGSELKHDFRDEGKYEIWETICSGCSYRKVEKTDWEKKKREDELEKKRDQELLATYRSRFCLKKEAAEEYINAFDELAFADQVYEYELQKLDTPEFEQTHNLKKLSITEVENTVNKAIVEASFGRLVSKEPEMDPYVEIDFSVQDMNTSRNQKESSQQLEDLLVKILKPTNWRLRDRVQYRLGFLTGRLRGYERDEDILKYLSKHKQKPASKIKLDPEKLKKYGHSNAVHVAKLLAEHEAKERVRRKRYKKEPDGFIMENHGNDYRDCGLCHRSIKGNETWWRPEARLCLDCNWNLKEGVFPIEILKNDKLYFNTWDVEYEFGLHNATVRKHIRNGDLIARELKDENGKTYHHILLAEDNVKFFKTHPREEERKQRWHYVDGKGRVVWL